MSSIVLEDSFCTKLLKSLGDLKNSKSHEETVVVSSACDLDETQTILKKIDFAEDATVDGIPNPLYEDLIYTENGSLYWVIEILRRFPENEPDDQKILTYIKNACRHLSFSEMSGLKRMGNFFTYEGHVLPEPEQCLFEDVLDPDGELPFDKSVSEDLRTLGDALFIRVAMISATVQFPIRDEQTLGSFLHCIYDHIVYHEMLIRSVSKKIHSYEKQGINQHKFYDVFNLAVIRFEKFLKSFT